MSRITVADVSHPQYNEAEALQTILRSADEAVGDANQLVADTEEFLVGKISIAVGGQITELYLGGPQLAGLDKMVEVICKENGYEVDLVARTVTA